ncbi:MAG: antibiotic biosynthesis monooxygenase family protein [Phycisphaerales bacterium JB043]
MIIRIFRAQIHDGMNDEFRALFENELLPIILDWDGCLGASIGLPMESSPSEFMMTSLWESLDTLKTFAGENWLNPVIDPKEKHLIKEATVHHYVMSQETGG